MSDDKATAVLLGTVMRHDLLSLDDAEQQKLLRLLSNLRGELAVATTVELVEDTGWAVTPDAELRIERVENARRIQEEKRIWNRDPYFLGMYNGLELAMSILEDRVPCYRGGVEDLMGGGDDAD
jgi:hypothetical protein